METIRIRDGKKSDPGSGINILDPQQWDQLLGISCRKQQELWIRWCRIRWVSSRRVLYCGSATIMWVDQLEVGNVDKLQ
jgi:hypothetical protein